jgi:glucose-6-phosphate 1-epimerase
MDKVVLSHSSGSVAEIYLAGGHVTSWKVPSTTGELQEQLFVSSTSKYGGGSAIRGGIPVCFPQFATDGPGKKHGFARNSEKWTVLNMQADNTSTTLRLIGDGTEDEKWPNAFVLDITLTLGAHSLQQSMKVTNTNAEAFSFTTALHTYFAVANARQTYLQGANGLSYLTTNEAKPGTFTEDRDKATMSEMTDRIYYDAPDSGLVLDEEGGRPGGPLSLIKSNFSDAVYWNIWEEGAAGMSDMGPGEWAHYTCVEAAQIKTPVVLGAGETWEAYQEFQVPNPRL